LQEHRFADSADICGAAIETVTSGRPHALLGLPTLLLDLQTENACEAEFAARLQERASECEALFAEGRAYGRFPGQLAALQTQLFGENVAAPARAEGLSFSRHPEKRSNVSKSRVGFSMQGRRSMSARCCCETRGGINRSSKMR